MDMRVPPTTARRRRDDVSAGQRTTTLLLTGGVVGPVLFVLAFLVEGATRPGYSAWRNFVSQLSLSDQGWEQIANFLVCGMLCLGFAFGLRRVLRSGTGATAGPVLLGIFALGLIIAGLFSTGPALGYPPGAEAGKTSETLPNIVHGLAGLVCFSSLPFACFALARRFAHDPAWHGWASYSILTGIVIATCFIASLVVAELDRNGVMPEAPAGLLQRIAIIAGWGWIALLAARLRRSVSTRSTRAAGAQASA